MNAPVLVRFILQPAFSVLELRFWRTSEKRTTHPTHIGGLLKFKKKCSVPFFHFGLMQTSAQIHFQSNSNTSHFLTNIWRWQIFSCRIRKYLFEPELGRKGRGDGSQHEHLSSPLKCENSNFGARTSWQWSWIRMFVIYGDDHWKHTKRKLILFGYNVYYMYE